MSKILMVGLPGTGKTTFLAALWHVVYWRKVPDSMELVELPDIRDYLVNISDNWTNCKEQIHTPTATEKLIELKLRNPSDGFQAEVVFPDLSGEWFRMQWEDRHWSKAYDQLARDSKGALIFIHPKKVREPQSITQVMELCEVLAEGEEPGDEQAVEQGIGSAMGVDWKPEFAPTQVQLIDLLQFLLFSPCVRATYRIAVVISAWDIVSALQLEPIEWLRQRLPMLHQFLAANVGVLEAKVFGISAQGGDLTRDEGKLKNTVEPSDRIVVQRGTISSHDITAPVRWVLTGR